MPKTRACKIEEYIIRWPFIYEPPGKHDHPVAGGWDALPFHRGFGHWSPGWHSELDGPYGQSEVLWCDAEGWMVLTVVSRHKPTPRHMERVFAYRRLYDPFGKPTFARPVFITITQGKLERYLNGTGYPPVEVEGDLACKYELVAPYVAHDEYLAARLPRLHPRSLGVAVC